MSNEYYNAPDAPVDFTKARSAQVREQFSAIEQGFSKLPTPDEILNGTKGPKGDKGDKGDPGGPVGPEGDSAYQVAVDNGFVGSQAQWLASLVGPMGPQGGQGPQGVQGPQGPEGPQGPTGAGGSWNTLGDKPANLAALAAAVFGAGDLPVFDGAGAVVGSTISELFAALPSEEKAAILNALNVPRVESLNIAPNGYLELALPDENGSIIVAWGSGNFYNGNTPVTYPKAGTLWSVCVVSGTGPNNDDQRNAPGTKSTSPSGFVVNNSRKGVAPAWWIAIIR